MLLSDVRTTVFILVLLFGLGITSARGDVILAPVRYWGDLSYEYRDQSIDNEEDQAQQLTTLNLNASSYLWQPWFASITGGLGLTYHDTKTDSNNTSGEIVTSNARLLMLPQSRFPLELHYEESDSRVSGDNVSSTPYSNTRYGVIQKYRSLDGSTSMQATHDHTVQQMQGEQADVSDLYTLGVNQSFEHQQLQFDVSREETKRRSNDTNYQTENALARHSYRPDSSFTMDNMASIVETEDMISSIYTNTSQLQVTSNSFWRSTDSPLMMNMGARYYETLNESETATTDNSNSSAYAGLNYDISKHLRLTSNVTLNRATSDGRTTDTSTQSVGMVYHPEYIDWGKFKYHWMSSLNVANRSGADDEGQHASGQLGHNLQRNYEAKSGAVWNTSIGQSVTVEFDTNQDSVTRLEHNGSLGWRHSQGSSNTYVRLTLSDSRTVDSSREEVYQLINFQASRNKMMNSVSSWTGSLTIQAYRQEYTDNPDAGFRNSSSASLVYQHTKVFDVPRLHFTSDLKLNAEELLPVASGEQEQERKVWLNRVDYVIGRLSLQLSLRLSELGNQSHEVLMFRLKRLFGD